MTCARCVFKWQVPVASQGQDEFQEANIITDGKIELQWVWHFNNSPWLKRWQENHSIAIKHQTKTQHNQVAFHHDVSVITSPLETRKQWHYALLHVVTVYWPDDLLEPDSYLCCWSCDIFSTSDAYASRLNRVFVVKLTKDKPEALVRKVIGGLGSGSLKPREICLFFCFKKAFTYCVCLLIGTKCYYGEMLNICVLPCLPKNCLVYSTGGEKEQESENSAKIGFAVLWC